MQIIACQLDIVWEDKSANHERVRRMLAGATVKSDTLVVLPEMSTTGFSMHVNTIAETADGPTHSFLASLAREFKCFVMAGVVTQAADGRGRNESVTYDPQGRLAARYAKLHPFSYAGETKHYESGQEIVIFECHGFQVAPFVCYDLRFPEVFRQAVRRGAELLVVIANWPHAREAHWLALLAARAIENQAYVVGVNRAGSDPHARYGGRSQIIGPRGQILAEAGADEQLLVGEIERAPLIAYRSEFPALGDMRRDFIVE